MKDLAAVAVAGALGAVSRYGIAVWARGHLPMNFPWGTWIANVVGCLLLGFFMQWTLDNPQIPRSVKLGVGPGFLGAFTTFSTFSYETVRAAQYGTLNVALANIAANLVVGLAFAELGIQIARSLA